MVFKSSLVFLLILAVCSTKVNSATQELNHDQKPMGFLLLDTFEKVGGASILQYVSKDPGKFVEAEIVGDYFPRTGEINPNLPTPPSIDLPTPEDSQISSPIESNLDTTVEIPAVDISVSNEDQVDSFEVNNKPEVEVDEPASESLVLPDNAKSKGKTEVVVDGSESVSNDFGDDDDDDESAIVDDGSDVLVYEPKPQVDVDDSESDEEPEVVVDGSDFVFDDPESDEEPEVVVDGSDFVIDDVESDEEPEVVVDGSDFVFDESQVVVDDLGVEGDEEPEVVVDGSDFVFNEPEVVVDDFGAEGDEEPEVVVDGPNAEGDEEPEIVVDYFEGDEEPEVVVDEPEIVYDNFGFEGDEEPEVVVDGSGFVVDDVEGDEEPEVVYDDFEFEGDELVVPLGEPDLDEVASHVEEAGEVIESIIRGFLDEDGECGCVDEENCLETVEILVNCVDGECTVMLGTETDIDFNAKLVLTAIPDPLSLGECCG